mmetsp:Transcript_15050/g.25773  ORF Transcript_15050/g.25773 Transcript_15050/m.25773 type:complete len:95 (+) Transcript_15050:519-803(+)
MPDAFYCGRSKRSGESNELVETKPKNLSHRKNVSKRQARQFKQPRDWSIQAAGGSVCFTRYLHDALLVKNNAVKLTLEPLDGILLGHTVLVAKP